MHRIRKIIVAILVSALLPAALFSQNATASFRKDSLLLVRQSASLSEQVYIDSVLYVQKIKEQELLQMKADQQMQQKINYIFILLIVVSFIVLIILITGYHRSKAQKKVLEEKNQLLNSFNERLVLSENELKRMNDDKNRIFSIVAHDLRNPVSAISGFTDLLSDKYHELDEESRMEYLEQISVGTKRALTLLDNMLLWARSQMDLITIKKTEIAVERIIRDCVADLSCSIDKKKIVLQTDIRDRFNLYIDVEMVKAVLRNLISNAIKFSYPGNTVTIASTRNENHLCISVKDEGTGIRADVLSKLFSSGNITTTEGTLREKGSGLGLMIAKDYTERNGGEIHVKTKEGKGSEFTICFSE